MYPYADKLDDYWTGFYTSRPNAKRQVRVGQANLVSSSKLYSLKVIDQQATDQQIKDVIKAKNHMLDAMGIY